MRSRRPASTSRARAHDISRERRRGRSGHPPHGCAGLLRAALRPPREARGAGQGPDRRRVRDLRDVRALARPAHIDDRLRLRRRSDVRAPRVDRDRRPASRSAWWNAPRPDPGPPTIERGRTTITLATPLGDRPVIDAQERAAHPADRPDPGRPGLSALRPPAGRDVHARGGGTADRRQPGRSTTTCAATTRSTAARPSKVGTGRTSSSASPATALATSGRSSAARGCARARSAPGPSPTRWTPSWRRHAASEADTAAGSGFLDGYGRAGFFIIDVAIEGQAVTVHVVDDAPGSCRVVHRALRPARPHQRRRRPIRMRRTAAISSFIVAALLALAAPASAQTPPVCVYQPPAPEPTQAEKELAELKGYAAQRKQFGFRSDLAYVRKLIKAGRWESDVGFIPVTKREDEYLQLRDEPDARQRRQPLPAAAPRRLRRGSRSRTAGRASRTCSCASPRTSSATSPRSSGSRASRTTCGRSGCATANGRSTGPADRVSDDFKALAKAPASMCRAPATTPTRASRRSSSSPSAPTRRPTSPSATASSSSSIVKGTETTVLECAPSTAFKIEPDGLTIRPRYESGGGAEYERTEVTEIRGSRRDRRRRTRPDRRAHAGPAVSATRPRPRSAPRSATAP